MRRQSKFSYLAGALSFSHHSNGSDNLFILGDHHVRTAESSNKECSNMKRTNDNVIGVEEWIKQKTATPNTHIILEVDPVLTRTMQLDNSWIAEVQESLESTKTPVYYSDVRGRALLNLFPDTIEGHRQINSYLTNLYLAADELLSRRREDIADRKAQTRLAAMEGYRRKWTDRLVEEEALRYSEMVDTFVQDQIVHLFRQNRAGPLTIILFVGEAHADIYRRWLKTENVFNLRLVLLQEPTALLSKCLDISALPSA